VEVRHINRSSFTTYHPKVYTGTTFFVFNFGPQPCGNPPPYSHDIANRLTSAWRYGARSELGSSGFSDRCCAADPRASSPFTVLIVSRQASCSCDCQGLAWALKLGTHGRSVGYLTGLVRSTAGCDVPSRSAMRMV
jgi:hypothetical protein